MARINADKARWASLSSVSAFIRAIRGLTRVNLMRVFVSEFVSGGGWPEPEIGGSLAIEGAAMLRAVADDLARIDGVRVTTTWDARLGPPPFDNVHTIVVDSPDDELPVFRELAHLCDATLVIAPETQCLLEQRCRIVEGAAGRLLGPDSGAVGTCTSKLCLHDILSRAGVLTIPTNLWQSQWPPEQFSFPIVIKPDDGAGSQNTFLVRDGDELQRLPVFLSSNSGASSFVRQPYVCGTAVSVGVLCSRDGMHRHVFPPAEQTLSQDGRFHYLGGVIPARGVDLEAIQSVARAACRAVPGLRGYVGVDVIVPEESPERPVVCEINPRLTTSYIGYRRLARENLAERILDQENPRPIAWDNGPVLFRADGAVE